MPLSVTVTHPMPEAVVPLTFPVCGTYMALTMGKEILDSEDRNAILQTTPTITVSVSNSGGTYGPFAASFCPESGGWEATATVPAGAGYTVTATIQQGSNLTSHAIESVTVQNNPRMRLVIECCAVKAPAEAERAKEEPPNRVEYLPFGAVRKKVSLNGDFTPNDAEEMFGVVWGLADTATSVALPSGGTHYTVTSRRGDLVRPGLGGELKPGKKWKLTDIEVDSGTYVILYLKNRTNVIGQVASARY